MRRTSIKASIAIYTLVGCLAGLSGFCAAQKPDSKKVDLKKAQNTVNNIKQPEPPKVSTTTKPSPVGQSVTTYKPKGPSVKAKAPPPPGKWNTGATIVILLSVDRWRKICGDSGRSWRQKAI